LPLPADPETVEPFGFIADPYLEQLNPGSVGGRQVFDQFTKVYPLFGREVKCDLIAIELVFNIDKFHPQVMFRYEFQAFLKSLLLFLPVERQPIEIEIASLPEYFMRFSFLAALAPAGFPQYLSVVFAALRLDNNEVADADIQPAAVGKAFTAVSLKTDYI